MRERPRTTVSVGLIAAGIALVVTAVVFTETLTTARVADNARDLHWANATTGVGATARSALVQATVLAAGSQLGFVDPANVIAALGEARAHLESLRGWAAVDVTVRDASLDTELLAYIDSLEYALEALEAGDFDRAGELVSGSVEAAWGVLEIDLAAAQKTAVDAVSATEGLAGLIGFVTRIAITLVLPVGALATYRYRARKQVLAARAKFEAEIATQRRLADQKNDLITGMSHELRTPLTSIFGFSEVLAEQASDPEVVELVGVIHNEARALRRMIDDFIAASRLSDTSLTSSPTDVAIAEIVANELRAAGTGSVRTNLAPATVAADPNMLPHIVRNLVSNAVTHGGPTIWVSGEIRGGSYHLAVSDDGPGIDPERIDRAFESFANDGGRALTSGSVGLGLYVARNLARLCGGDIHYVRRDGWTHFVVTTPLATPEVAPDTGRSATARAA